MWKKQPDSKIDGTESTLSEAPLMEIRGDKKQQMATQVVTSQVATIGPTVKITGEINADEDLVIHGKVEGQIRIPNHTVVVGKEGEINANVSANVIHVEGTLNGDIRGGDQVIVRRSGNVRGNVTAPRVTLEDGAKFKGTIDMDPAQEQVQETADRSMPGWNPSRWDSKPSTSDEGISDAEEGSVDESAKSFRATQ